MSVPDSGAAPEITSVQNPAVVQTAKLHRARERRRRSQTLLEGPNLLRAAVAAGHRPEVVFALAGDDETGRLCVEAGLGLRIVSDAVLNRLALTASPRGPVAVLNVPEPSRLRPEDTLVLLGVADPGNAGTLIRSAAAFGFHVVVGRDTVDVWSPKTLRAGAGAHFAVAIGAVAASPVGELRSAGLAVAAAVPASGERIENVRRPAALLIGNEPGGLAPDVVASADAVVSIPMRESVESLNAAVAGSILMYEWARASGSGR